MKPNMRMTLELETYLNFHNSVNQEKNEEDWLHEGERMTGGYNTERTTDNKGVTGSKRQFGNKENPVSDGGEERPATVEEVREKQRRQ
ncbi:hypothetical protein U1Q18_015345 [Sarracenia purpurea var. burkii]